MALKPCKECKHEISSDVRRCPTCGAKQRMGCLGKGFVGVGVLVLGGVALQNAGDSLGTSEEQHFGSPLANPATWAIKPHAYRTPSGDIIISASTNIPDGVKLWVQLPTGAIAETHVIADQLSAGPLSNRGKWLPAGPHQVSFLAYFNAAWEQPPAVMALTGENGMKLQGKLFRKTDPDVIDSHRILDYRTIVVFPPVPQTAQAIALVKSATLVVDGRRSSATIGKTVEWFLQPSTGIRVRNGWSAIPIGGDTYEVRFDNTDGLAIWRTNLRTRQIKYMNLMAKHLSYLSPD